MTTVASLVVIASLVALLVVGIEDIVGSGHVVFANRGINVQTDTNQDQGCEPAGGMSGITNACTATSTPGSTQTTVTLTFSFCTLAASSFNCNTPGTPNFCNNIGCTSISCDRSIFAVGGTGNCTTNNGVQLTSCTITETEIAIGLTCTRTGTGGITNSGGVTGDDSR